MYGRFRICTTPNVYTFVYTLQYSYKALRTILGTEMYIKISTYIRNRIFRNN